MDQAYKKLVEQNKSIYKQESSKTDRRNNNIDDLYKFNQYSHSFFIERSEFSRDKDRILFSRAFRRLEDKAQIFSHERGDHYRTRLTHTLEVLQIARNICRYLGFNEDLVEAITLGHDIGHTPFGHEGERVLDQVLCGKADFKEIRYQINYSGFKHNYNSLKVLDLIEIKYENEKGLNLTWQVLEGILKHTKTRRNGVHWCDIDRFMLNDGINILFNKKLRDMLIYENSVTLEGQIVAIADEIAQRQHDLDDGMRDEKSGLNYKYVLHEINEYIDYTLANHKDSVDKDFIDLMEDLKSRIVERDTKRSEMYKKDTMIRDIIEYFICDVTLSSFKNIDRDGKKTIIPGEDRIFSNKLIDFSVLGTEFDKKLSRYIKNHIVNSNGVNKFDGKANYVIKQLFKAYYSNPRQMSDFSLQRLLLLIKANSKIYSIKLNNFKDETGANLGINNINFSVSSPDEVDQLIKYLKMELNLKDLCHPFGSSDNGYLEENGKFKLGELNTVNLLVLDKVMELNDDKIRFIKCMLEDHYAYLSTICDYISGMTDNYANREYSQLYQT